MSKRIDYEGHPDLNDPISAYISEQVSKIIDSEANQDWIDTVIFLSGKSNNLDKQQVESELELLLSVS